MAVLSRALPDRRRPVRGVGIVGLAVVGLALLGSGAAAAPRRPDTLVVVRNMSDHITNDPSRAFEFTSQLIGRAIYDTLVTVEPPDLTRIQPSLATRWTVSPDGTVYTFALRPGVRFASGNPLTAHDVRFSFRRLRHLGDQPSFFADRISEIEAVNDATVRIVLRAPDASFLAALAGVPMGILDARAVVTRGGTDGEDAREKDRATGWLDTASAGTGPYRLVSFSRDVAAVLERNPRYWGSPPHFARILVRHVTSGVTQREMVERGDAHVSHDIDAALAAGITRGPRIRVLSSLSLNVIYLALNPEVSKELADRRVRQAISYAIDYEGIVTDLLRGGAEQPPANLPIGVLGVDRDLARRRDLGQAKQLLARAGYPDGFAARLSYWTRPLQGIPNDALAAKLQADLGEAGIRVTPEPKEFSVLLPEFRAGKLAMTVAEWTPDYVDPGPWADAFYRKGGPVARRVAYDNPRMTELVASARREGDARKRTALYRQLQRMALEDVPYVPLVQPRLYAAVSPAITGYVIHPIWSVTLARLGRGPREAN